MVLEKIRNKFAEMGIDGFVAYNTDSHLNEYIADADKRIQFVTDFTGSWAFLVILKEKAAIFVDGRYTRQAMQQVQNQNIEVLEYPTNRPTEWIIANSEANDVICYDSWLLSASMADGMEQSLVNAEIQFKPCKNVIDMVWEDKPKYPQNSIENHELKYSGQESDEKLAAVRDAIKKQNAEYLLLSSMDNIAWLFNLRGSDISYNPLFYSYAIIGQDEVFLYSNDPEHKSLNDFKHDLLYYKNKKVLVDYNNTVKGITNSLENMIKSNDICGEMKAIKNPIELRGMKWSHFKEGIVFAKLFSWLSHKKNKKNIDELKIMAKIEKLRKELENYKGPSFETIAGVDSNAGIVHYAATQETNKTLDGKILLIDSGAQYLEGTTDMTRTISLNNKPTSEQKHIYTLVLKGHLAVSRAVFPKHVRPSQLDTYARQFLWEQGLDYSHGTGHGVGCYLCVHETPPSISPNTSNQNSLKPGMVMSNEPGCYNDEFGVRIENLIKVIEIGDSLGFEDLTLIPYDNRLFSKDLLTKQERNQINQYHARVLEKISPYLDKTEQKWLKKACKKL